MSAPSALMPFAEFEVAQEDDAVAGRKISAVLGVGVIVTIASVAISGFIVAALTGRAEPRNLGAPGTAPRQIAGIHQTPIERDRHGWEKRDEQRRSLEAYRWVDRERGIAQIPIERAMQMLIDDTERQKGAR